ncbi:2-oxoacid:ferredoxin oxidoreductase subunit beta [Candidatus Gottesmanbacteria bacterium]|nr:2-oxoacid:ferredoxin oxidoreductase subunit beta [Candidatus Gottesmanbacteria bacterium]
MSDPFKTPCQPNWCPGCGDFGIWAGIKNAIRSLGWTPADFVAVYGVGCHGHMVNFLKSYAFETLHGRPIPVAEGLHLANHKLPVLVIAGDGDTLGEGTNHLVHAARRNIDLTIIMHDNQVYGLTTGQTAPTAQKGFKTKSTPAGSIEEPINPLSIAIAAGATFVARGFAGDIPSITNLIVEGIKHPGLSFVDIFQPCVTFNHVNTYQWYRDHIYNLPEDYKADDRAEAYKKALEWTEKIPVGVFYRELKPTYEEQTPQIAETSLVDSAPVSKEVLTKLIGEFV